MLGASVRGVAVLGPVQRFWESDRISVILSAVAFVGYSALWWSAGAPNQPGRPCSPGIPERSTTGVPRA